MIRITRPLQLAIASFAAADQPRYSPKLSPRSCLERDKISDIAAGSQAPAWEPRPGSSASRRHLPIPNHLNQPRLTGVIACTGITPLFRLIYIPTLDRIPMDIVQLLQHDRFGFDDLRMVAFFPDLISRVLFVGALEELQQFQRGKVR